MFRTFLFWLHLAAGVVAGVVILVMSATGVALTYERQLNAWTTSHLRSAPPTSASSRMPLETLVARVAEARADVTPGGVTVGAAADAPVTVTAEPTPLFVDAYSAQELGDRRGAGLRSFLQTMRSWHRWLGADADNRAVARAITGWSNLLFLFIVTSGVYLWLPRTWRWLQFKQVLWFKREYGTTKARDFNWHHVVGIWSAIPLFVIVLGAVPMSFPWANNALYRVVGEQPPAPGRPGGPGGAAPGGPGGPGAQAARGPGRGPTGDGRRREAGGRGASAPSLDGLDAAFARAQAESADWRTISVRFPRNADEPLAFTIDRGDGGQPHLRSTLTVTRTGDVVSRETFSGQAGGRRLRSILRFAHTGEVFGLTGQTIAGLATGGAVVMVWTGLALSFRRLVAWRARRRERALSSPSVAALHDAAALSSQESL